MASKISLAAAVVAGLLVGSVVRADEGQPTGRSLAADPGSRAAASVRYFRSATSLLGELNARPDTRTLAQRVYWYRQYAARLQTLPTRDVDPDLLQYGAAVRSALQQLAANAAAARAMGQSLMASTVDTPVVVPTAVYHPYGAYGWYGWYGYGPYWGYPGYRVVPQLGHYTNYQDVARAGSAVAAAERGLREQTWWNIDEATHALRVKLSERYGVDF
jgi:hypothetical protein